MRIGHALALFTCLASACHAAAIVVPPSLAPGDTYRIIFVTSTTRDALSADIGDYNAFVTTAANLDSGLAGLGTTWTALASTTSVNVLANTGLSASDSTTRFFNTAGELISIGVLNAGGLYDPLTLHTAFIRNEGGAIPSVPASGYDPRKAVWTGTNFDSVTLFPLGNTEIVFPFSVPRVLQGIPTNPFPGQWTGLNTLGPAFQASLYGISGVLTVPTPIPEPSTLALLGSAILMFGLSKIRGARQ